MILKDVTSLQAFELFTKNDFYKLIDVRFEEEWKRLGVPNAVLQNKSANELQDKAVLAVHQPASAPQNSLGSFNNENWHNSNNTLLITLNPIFKEQLMEQIPNKNTNIFFICKSGGRSRQACELAISLGYNNCYNIIDGYEGSQFGKGWKANNLPWQNL